ALGVCIYLIIKKQNIVLPCVFLVLGCFFAFLSSNLLPTEMLIKNELIFNIFTKIQFPFRFITLATICFVTFFALVFKKAMPKNLRQIACLIIIFASLLSTGIFYMTNHKPDYKGSSLAINTKSPPEYLMEGADPLMMKFWDSRLSGTDNIKFTSYSRDGMHHTATFNKTDDSDGAIFMPAFYYEGYVATINDKQVHIQPSNDQLIEIPHVKNTSGKINLWFEGLPQFKIYDKISLISLILLIVYITARYISLLYLRIQKKTPKPIKK
ncbi:MAG: hypothetical protein RR052_05530, partial [Oscillospiraceae bacterium]